MFLQRKKENTPNERRAFTLVKMPEGNTAERI